MPCALSSAISLNAVKQFGSVLAACLIRIQMIVVRSYWSPVGEINRYRETNALQNTESGKRVRVCVRYSYPQTGFSKLFLFLYLFIFSHPRMTFTYYFIFIFFVRTRFGWNARSDDVIAEIPPLYTTITPQIYSLLLVAARLENYFRWVILWVRGIRLKVFRMPVSSRPTASGKMKLILIPILFS